MSMTKRRTLLSIHIPVSHHLEAFRADGVHYLSSLFSVGDFEFLLKEDRRLLVGGLDYTSDE